MHARRKDIYVITRDVEPGAVADLALAPPRAALACLVDDEIRLFPVEVTLDEPAEPAESTRVVTVPDGIPDLAGRNVVVIADDGPQWFRLRSLTVRGTARPVDDRTYRVAPRRVVAWDYGSLRDVRAEPSERPAPSLPGNTALNIEPLHLAELDAALRSSHVMILASRSRKGTPFAVPLWFVVHRGRLYTGTSISSWTVRNVASCPDVCLLLGGERGGDDERLVVRGRATSVAGPPPAAVLARIAWRYYLQPRFAADELRHIGLWGRRLRYYSQAQAAHLVITPQSIDTPEAPRRRPR